MLNQNPGRIVPGLRIFLRAHLAILDGGWQPRPIQCLRLDLIPCVSDVFKDEASHPKTTSTGNASFTHTEVYFPEASIHWPSLYTMRPPHPSGSNPSLYTMYATILSLSGSNPYFCTMRPPQAFPVPTPNTPFFPAWQLFPSLEHH